MGAERWILAMRVRLRALFRRDPVDRELDEELRYHVERKTEENIARGMTPQEARRAALIDAGGIEQAKEDCRDTRGFRWIDDFAKDARFGLRMLRKNPGFSTVAILTLALGIGANTAIFSFVDATLLRPLPFRNPDKLVQLWETERAPGQYPLIGADYLDWQAENKTLEGSTLYSFAKLYNASGIGEAETASIVAVQANFFSFLGVEPRFGRGFAAGEDQPGKNHLAVLSDAFAQRHFSAGDEALGKTIELNGEFYTVTGVMPRAFAFPTGTDIWIPADMSASGVGDRNSHQWRGIGRIRDGYTPAQVQAELATISKQLEKKYPNTNKDTSAFVILLKEQLTAGSRPALLVLFGAVSLLLLLASANIANLLLARAATRQREMAVRTALGASRWRVIRQLITEGVILTFSGALLGVAGALYAVEFLRPDSAPSIQHTNWVPGLSAAINAPQIDVRVLLFTVAICVLAGVFFGLAPALQISRVGLDQELKAGAQTILSTTKHRALLRECLVAGEIAIALALVIGAGLLLRSFAKLRSTNIGVQTTGILTFGIALPPASYSTLPKQREFFDQLLGRVDIVPGVTAAAVSSELPLEGGQNGFISVPGMNDPGRTRQLVEWNYITHDYFQTMGIRFLQGDNFTGADADRAGEVMLKLDDLYKAGKLTPSTQLPKELSLVAIINRRLARLYWPNENAVGKVFNDFGLIPTKVIGVVGNVNEWSVREAPIPQAYFPLTQALDDAGFAAKITVKTGLPPLAVLPAIRADVADIDRGLALSRVRTMDEVVGQSIHETSDEATLLGIFGALGLVLAAIGVYGVMAYSVTQRQHEIGVRVALGAGQRDIFRLVVLRGVGVTGIGLIAGAAGATALTRLMANLMFSVRPTDPLTFAGSAALLLAVALVACVVPARKAMRVDPMVALRHE